MTFFRPQRLVWKLDDGNEKLPQNPQRINNEVFNPLKIQEEYAKLEKENQNPDLGKMLSEALEKNNMNALEAVAEIITHMQLRPSQKYKMMVALHKRNLLSEDALSRLEKFLEKTVEDGEIIDSQLRELLQNIEVQKLAEKSDPEKLKKAVEKVKEIQYGMTLDVEKSPESQKDVYEYFTKVFIPTFFMRAFHGGNKGGDIKGFSALEHYDLREIIVDGKPIALDFEANWKELQKVAMHEDSEVFAGCKEVFDLQLLREAHENTSLISELQKSRGVFHEVPNEIKAPFDAKFITIIDKYPFLKWVFVGIGAMGISWLFTKVTSLISYIPFIGKPIKKFADKYEGKLRIALVLGGLGMIFGEAYISKIIGQNMWKAAGTAIYGIVDKILQSAGLGILGKKIADKAKEMVEGVGEKVKEKGKEKYENIKEKHQGTIDSFEEKSGKKLEGIEKKAKEMLNKRKESQGKPVIPKKENLQDTWKKMKENLKANDSEDPKMKALREKVKALENKRFQDVLRQTKEELSVPAEMFDQTVIEAGLERQLGQESKELLDFIKNIEDYLTPEELESCKDDPEKLRGLIKDKYAKKLGVLQGQIEAKKEKLGVAYVHMKNLTDVMQAQPRDFVKEMSNISTELMRSIPDQVEKTVKDSPKLVVKRISKHFEKKNDTDAVEFLENYSEGKESGVSAHAKFISMLLSAGFQIGIVNTWVAITDPEGHLYETAGLFGYDEEDLVWLASELEKDDAILKRLMRSSHTKFMFFVGGNLLYGTGKTAEFFAKVSEKTGKKVAYVLDTLKNPIRLTKASLIDMSRLYYSILNPLTFLSDKNKQNLVKVLTSGGSSTRVELALKTFMENAKAEAKLKGVVDFEKLISSSMREIAMMYGNQHILLQSEKFVRNLADVSLKAKSLEDLKPFLTQLKELSYEVRAIEAVDDLKHLRSGSGALDIFKAFQGESGVAQSLLQRIDDLLKSGSSMSGAQVQKEIASVLEEVAKTFKNSTLGAVEKMTNNKLGFLQKMKLGITSVVSNEAALLKSSHKMLEAQQKMVKELSSMVDSLTHTRQGVNVAKYRALWKEMFTSLKEVNSLKKTLGVGEFMKGFSALGEIGKGAGMILLDGVNTYFMGHSIHNLLEGNNYEALNDALYVVPVLGSVRVIFPDGLFEIKTGENGEYICEWVTNKKSFPEIMGHMFGDPFHFALTSMGMLGMGLESWHLISGARIGGKEFLNRLVWSPVTSPLRTAKALGKISKNIVKLSFHGVKGSLQLTGNMLNFVRTFAMKQFGKNVVVVDDTSKVIAHGPGVKIPDDLKSAQAKNIDDVSNVKSGNVEKPLSIEDFKNSDVFKNFDDSLKTKFNSLSAADQSFVMKNFTEIHANHGEDFLQQFTKAEGVVNDLVKTTKLANFWSASLRVLRSVGYAGIVGLDVFAAVNAWQSVAHIDQMTALAKSEEYKSALQNIKNTESKYALGTTGLSVVGTATLVLDLAIKCAGVEGAKGILASIGSSNIASALRVGAKPMIVATLLLEVGYQMKKELDASLQEVSREPSDWAARYTPEMLLCQLNRIHEDGGWAIAEMLGYKPVDQSLINKDIRSAIIKGIIIQKYATHTEIEYGVQTLDHIKNEVARKKAKYAFAYMSQALQNNLMPKNVEAARETVYQAMRYADIAVIRSGFHAGNVSKDLMKKSEDFIREMYGITSPLREIPEPPHGLVMKNEDFKKVQQLVKTKSSIEIKKYIQESIESDEGKNMYLNMQKRFAQDHVSLKEIRQIIAVLLNNTDKLESQNIVSHLQRYREMLGDGVGNVAIHPKNYHINDFQYTLELAKYYVFGEKAENLNSLMHIELNTPDSLYAFASNILRKKTGIIVDPKNKKYIEKEFPEALSNVYGFYFGEDQKWYCQEVRSGDEEVKTASDLLRVMNVSQNNIFHRHLEKDFEWWRSLDTNESTAQEVREIIKPFVKDRILVKQDEFYTLLDLYKPFEGYSEFKKEIQNMVEIVDSLGGKKSCVLFYINVLDTLYTRSIDADLLQKSGNGNFFEQVKEDIKSGFNAVNDIYESQFRIENNIEKSSLPKNAELYWVKYNDVVGEITLDNEGNIWRRVIEAFPSQKNRMQDDPSKKIYYQRLEKSISRSGETEYVFRKYNFPPQEFAKKYSTNIEQECKNYLETLAYAKESDRARYNPRMISSKDDIIEKIGQWFSKQNSPHGAMDKLKDIIDTQYKNTPIDREILVKLNNKDY